MLASKRESIGIFLGVTLLMTVSVLTGFKAFSLTPRLTSGQSEIPSRKSLSPKAVRIISVDYRSDEILLSLVPTSQILALSLDADNPEMSNIVSQAASIPLRLDLNVERVLSLEPDVVVVGQVSLDDPIEMLEAADVRVIRLNSGNTLAEIQENIKKIANGVGDPDGGVRLVDEMNQRLAALRALTGSLPHPRTLYIYLGGASTETAGSGTYINELLEIAGAVNIAKEAGVQGWGALTVERIIELNPDVIIYADSTGRDKTRDIFPATDLAHNPVWQDISAVKRGRVYRMPGRYLFCATHFNVRTAEAMTSVLHPEIQGLRDGKPEE